MTKHIKMRLWLLKREKMRPYYDVADGFIVRAETEDDARKIASLDAGDEGNTTWLSAKYSSCEPLSEIGPAQSILRDFNAG